ncbi:hypothetical protein [Flavobacterium pectinovorum]|uniref:hypothetical protein n=1 Tax=Flavobacterium pectinovorum TaxID=29533 RepID=UPI001129CA12|nr:hypothetical protein [Flavobacterium pectinovorum]
MRNIIILSILVFISCQKKEVEKLVKLEEEMRTKDVVGTTDFHKIGYSVKENYLDSLAKHINPNRKYKYWQYVAYNQNSSSETYTVLKQGGDSILRKKINEKPRPNYNVGIFFGGHPNFRCNYVVIIDNGRVNSLKTEEQFRDFLGTIDNLEEAILLARTYGYELDNDIRGSEYRNLQNGFELHLMKYHEFPTRRESVEIKISRDGFIKTKSLGIYCEGLNCR